MATTDTTAALNDLIKFVVQGVEKQDPLVLGIGIALVVIIFTIVVLNYISRRKNTRRGVLLVGLCDSGKTLLFSRLINGRYVMTQTSITENTASYDLKGNKKGSLKILDLPGHERLRTQRLDKFKDQARGLVFTIDSVTFQKDIKEVAEFLYTLLSDKVISYNAPPILIACNKTDITTAKSKNLIKKQLEKEINMLRVTRSAALQATDGSAGSNQFLGKQGKDFEFCDLNGLQIDFVECSAKGVKGNEGEADICEIETWLENIA